MEWHEDIYQIKSQIKSQIKYNTKKKSHQINLKKSQENLISLADNPETKETLHWPHKYYSVP